MPSFQKLTRAAMKAAKPGAVIREHDIIFERLPNGDGRFSINPRVEGKRIHRAIGLEKEGVTKEYAEKILEKLKTDSRDERFGLPKGRKYHIAFKIAALDYQERLKLVNGKNMKRKEEQFRLHLMPFFGNTSITAITTYDIDRYKALRKNAGAANGTINQELSNLSHFYGRAKEWGWINDRPFVIKKLPEEGKRTTYMTPEQCQNLMEVARTTNHELHLFIKLGLATAMRMGEMFSIRLENLDLEPTTIYPKI
jgi:integrase